MKTFTKKSLLGFFSLAILFSIRPEISIAQPYVDLANVKMQFYSPQPYDVDKGTNLCGYQQEATVLLPLEQKNKDVILVGGDYTKLHFHAKGDQSMSANLYSTSLLLGVDLGLKNEKWRVTALVLPKINSDYKDISMDDAQIGGVLMFNYKKKENLKYHFGLYYNREFFGDYFMPLLGIDWKINDRINLFGDLPNNLNFEYKISRSMYIGASFLSIISSYRLSSASGGMYVREGDKSLGHDELKLYVNAYLTKNLVLYVESGEAFYRTYTLYNSSNELQQTNSVFRKSHDGMFVNMGLAYRFRLD